MSTNPRPNKFGARCDRCGTHVPPGVGILIGKHHAKGAWLVEHTTCPSERPVAPAVAAADLADEIRRIAWILDGMWDTIACRSEVEECAESAEDLARMRAETARMVAEARALEAEWETLKGQAA